LKGGFLMSDEYDVAHYALYFFLVILVVVFLFSYIFSFYGEREVSVYVKYLHLKNVFDAEDIYECFVDDGQFVRSSFTQETLDDCTKRHVRVDFVSDDEKLILGDRDLYDPDFVWKEFVVYPKGQGVLTIEMESL
jgi:hypothetical protein